jgi:hypothetical protein
LKKSLSRAATAAKAAAPPGEIRKKQTCHAPFDMQLRLFPLL